MTTLTKKMAEDLTDYLADAGVRVQYLHSDIDTITRIEILRELRLGTIDVLVGINLLREGLDLPEVALVAILDADKEGFLRSASSLIQTMGRAARNVDGMVVLYADTVTDSMREAVSVTQRRRELQMAYNREHGIDPQTIRKSVTDILERLRGTSGGRGQGRAQPGRGAQERGRPGQPPPAAAGRGRCLDARRGDGADGPAGGRDEGGRRRAPLRGGGSAARRDRRAARLRPRLSDPGGRPSRAGSVAPCPPPPSSARSWPRYAAVASSRDADAYAALFTPDAVQVDPYPTPPNVGRDAIRAFIQRSFDACETMTFEVVEVHPVADRAAITFHITVTLAGGSTMHIRGVEIFTVTDDGLISAVDAYWGDEDVTFEVPEAGAVAAST